MKAPSLTEKQENVRILAWTAAVAIGVILLAGIGSLPDDGEGRRCSEYATINGDFVTLLYKRCMDY